MSRPLFSAKPKKALATTLSEPKTVLPAPGEYRIRFEEGDRRVVVGRKELEVRIP